MGAGGPGWQRLAELIRADAVALYRTHERFARSAHLGKRTVEKLLAGQPGNYRPDTVYRVEAALGWEHGSLEDVLAGRDVTYVQDGGLATIEEAWPHLSPRDRRIILAVLDALRG